MKSPQVAAARLEHGSKIYGAGGTEVRALDDVTVSFAAGQFTAIMGPSGSGKSTLMHCLAGLDSLTSGTVYIGDEDVTAMNERARTRLRRERIGFTFQSFMLTGDNQRTAQAIARGAGIDRTVAEVRPGDKVAEVTRVQAEGRVVAMWATESMTHRRLRRPTSVSAPGPMSRSRQQTSP